MPEVAVLFLAGIATALATGLGALPVFMLAPRLDALRPALWGLAIGVMTVAAIAGLLAPTFRQGPAWAVVAGVAVGRGLLAAARRSMGV